MKKNLIFTLALISAFAVINTTGLSQTKMVKDGVQNSSYNYAYDATDFAPADASKPSLVNSKAARNFSKYFKTITNATWFEATDGYRASFEADGIKTWVDYDKKGNWMHTIRIYDEKKLPKDIRHAVKMTYYDHAITSVHEIEIPGASPAMFCYIIHLENETSLIDLRSYDGEMEVLKQWVKK